MSTYIELSEFYGAPIVDTFDTFGEWIDGGGIYSGFNDGDMVERSVNGNFYVGRGQRASSQSESYLLGERDAGVFWE